jgi:ADP-heptose:LPS heptosyltransferase
MKYVFRKKRNVFLVRLLDLAGYALTWWGRRRRPRSIRRPESILVIRLDHIGDVLTATGVPKILKESFPSARVSFLTSSQSAPLLENNPFVDEVLIYDAPWFLKKRRVGLSSNSSFLGLVNILKKKGIDTAVGLRGDLRENLLMALAGIPQRIGYGITGGGFWLTKEAPYRKLGHERERALELLKSLGASRSILEPKIYFSEKEEADFFAKRALLGFETGKKTVGFQMEAGTPAKEWPREHALKFIQSFNENFPKSRLLVLGSKPVNLERQASWVTNLTGKTSLRELCLILKNLDAFVGPDSGPSHIAAALGIPTLFLYSGTNVYEQWKPVVENAQVLRHPVPCSPCGLEVCNVPGHPCLSKIEPEAAISILGNWL